MTGVAKRGKTSTEHLQKVRKGAWRDTAQCINYLQRRGKKSLGGRGMYVKPGGPGHRTARYGTLKTSTGVEGKRLESLLNLGTRGEKKTPLNFNKRVEWSTHSRSQVGIQERELKKRSARGKPC